ncbi:MAG: hypothetical protein ABW250_22070 [Pyrinomonadaceae bacterium]
MDIFNRLDSTTAHELRELLAHQPLLELLNDIIGTALDARDGQQQRDILDLARLAIAKHEYTRRLYSQLVNAVLATSLAEAAARLADLPQIDARLAMEMLALISELLALNESSEKGVFSFHVARHIAERFGLTVNRAVVLHQLGVYESRRGRFASAEEALKEAAGVFSQFATSRARQANILRARIYKWRLQLEPDLPEPDDLGSIMASDPQAGEIILMAKASKAIDRDNLVAAEALIGELRSRRGGEDLSTEALLLKARLTRRQGLYEEADMLLRQAAQRPDAASYKDILTWQSFYLARDLGHVDRSRSLLKSLEGKDDARHVDFQRATLAWAERDNETAERLFRSCLAEAENDSVRADCMGNLATVSSDGNEARRFMYEALGLYHKLGRHLDHAISLSHLATAEMVEGLMWKESGRPMIMQYQFTRADDLLRHAQEIAEVLGASSFLLDLLTKRAQLEFTRERYNVALHHFARAMMELELNYLTMSDHRRAGLFIDGYTALYGLAIRCALAAGRPDQALLFSEHSKARRFLRDATQIAQTGDAADIGPLAAEEEKLLAIIRPLRGRLLQQRPLSPQEQKRLYDAERELGELWRRMKQTSDGSDELAMRVQQPVEVGVLRRLVLGVKNEEALAPAEVEEKVQELPGGDVMQCRECFVYNRITSTFCSACDALLPKSGTLNMDLLMGNATEEALKEAYADHLYNRGVELFHDTQIEEAEHHFRQALEHSSHPDYSFFYGLCRLCAEDPAGALASFDEVFARQYAAKYPFWPLPASPSDFRRCVEPLRHDPASAPEALRCLLATYSAYLERRRHERKG